MRSGHPSVITKEFKTSVCTHIQQSRIFTIYKFRAAFSSVTGSVVYEIVTEHKHRKQKGCFSDISW